MNSSGRSSIFPITKSEIASTLFDHFIDESQKIGPVNVYPHKTMISIVNDHKRVAYITQAGKNFIDIVFPFNKRYDDNNCFRRIQQVPGRHVIYHHLRLLRKDDINDEVREFMRIAYEGI